MWGCSRASLLKPRLCFDLKLQDRLPLMRKAASLVGAASSPSCVSQRALSIFSAPGSLLYPWDAGAEDRWRPWRSELTCSVSHGEHTWCIMCWMQR